MRYELTQARLKDRVNYDPETGVMTRIRNSGTAKAGDIMGSVMSHDYLTAGVDGRQYLIHRLAWLYVYGEWPKNIDHINHKRDDNRIANLRAVTRTENQRNQSLRKTNASGALGVHWCARRQKWVAQIKAGGRGIYLGRYHHFIDAISARKSAENLYGFHPNHGRPL